MHLGLGHTSNEEANLISNNLQVFTDNGQGDYSRAEASPLPTQIQRHTKWRDCLSEENQTRRVGAKICWGFLPLCAFMSPKIPSWLPEEEANTEANSNYSFNLLTHTCGREWYHQKKIVFIVILLLFKMIKRPSSTDDACLRRVRYWMKI